MKQVKVQYEKTHLSALLAAVERGEEFVIARGDESRELGFVAYSVPNDFLDALPDEELVAWQGNGDLPARYARHAVGADRARTPRARSA